MAEPPSEASPPTLVEIAAAIAALNEQEKTLNEAVTAAEAVSINLKAQENELHAQLKVIEKQLHDAYHGYEQAKHNRDINANDITARRSALSRMIGATVRPENASELLEPLQLNSTLLAFIPFRQPDSESGATAFTAVNKRRRLEHQKKNAASSADNDEFSRDDETDYQEAPSADTSTRKRKRDNNEDDTGKDTPELRMLKAKHNTPGLLPWHFKTKAPAFLIGSESIIYFHKPFALSKEGIDQFFDKVLRLECPLCKGNASQGKSLAFFNGLNGCSLHVQRQHKGDPLAKLKDFELLPHLVAQVLSNEEVLAIRKQQAHVPAVAAFCISRQTDAQGKRVTKKSTSRKAVAAKTTTSEGPEPLSQATSSILEPPVSTPTSPAPTSPAPSEESQPADNQALVHRMLQGDFPVSRERSTLQVSPYEQAMAAARAIREYNASRAQPKQSKK